MTPKHNFLIDNFRGARDMTPPVIKQFTAIFKSTLEGRDDFEDLVYGEMIRLVLWRYLMLVCNLGFFCFCIGFNVPFNTFQVIPECYLLVTEGMITTL